ncbi:hypothetical protein D9M71_773450 [compost metagenome]
MRWNLADELGAALVVSASYSNVELVDFVDVCKVLLELLRIFEPGVVGETLACFKIPDDIFK